MGPGSRQCAVSKGHDASAGSPLELVQPDTLRWKVMEPVLLLGKHRFEAVDIRIRVKGGGNVSQIYGELSTVCLLTTRYLHTAAALQLMLMASIWTYSALSDILCFCAAIRQAIAKGIVAFYQKCKPPCSPTAVSAKSLHAHACSKMPTLQSVGLTALPSDVCPVGLMPMSPCAADLAGMLSYDTS